MSQNRSQIDMLLTKSSNGYFVKGAIAEEVLPLVTSAQYSGKLARYGTSHLRIVNSLKVGRGKYRQVESVAYATDSFFIEGHGLEDVVSKEDYRNVLDPFKAEEDKTLGVMSSLLLEKEKVLADTLGSTSIMTQNVTLTGTDQYNDFLNSDPIDDFITARATVKSGCGVPPNKVVMSWEVYNKLRFHPQMLDSLGFKQSRPGGLTVVELALALEVDKVLIGQCSYESAQEGQTSSLAPVWGKNVVFYYAPDSASLREVSLGFRVQIEGEAPRKVYKWSQNNPPGSTAVLVEDEYDQVIQVAGAGYLIKNAIA